MIKFIINSFECPSGSGWQRKSVCLISVISGRRVWFNVDIGNITGALLRMGYDWNQMQCLEVDVSRSDYAKRFDFKYEAGGFIHEHELTEKFIFSLNRKNGKIGT